MKSRKMEIIEKKLDEIRPYDNNPRLNDEAVPATAESIKEFGWQQPIVIDRDGVIVCGHTRYKAALKLGLKTVPCKYADELTPEQVDAYRLADNKTGELATWDDEKLTQELAKCGDFDMAAFGFDEQEEPDVEEKDIIEDEYVETAVKPIAQPGMLFRLGDHRLLCGDSTSQKDVEKLMADAKADVIITDPPYNVNYSAKSEVLAKAGCYSNPSTIATATTPIANDNMDDEAFVEFLISAFKAASSATRDGGAFYIFHSELYGHEFRQAVHAIKDMDMHETLIWVKNALVLGHADYQWKHEPILYGWKKGTHYFIDDRKQSTVLEDQMPDFNKMKKSEMKAMLEEIYSDNVSTTIIRENRPSLNDLHPTMKPIKLVARLMKNSSRPRENVLDIFGGSGSTMIAAEQLNRRCYMMELDPHYCDVIINRWETFTGKKAEVIND